MKQTFWRSVAQCGLVLSTALFLLIPISAQQTLGSINGVTVENTDESDGGIGDQRNFGIFVVNNTTLAGDIPTTSEAAALNTISITGSAIESFQKNGITVEYANATISGNTLTGQIGRAHV